MNHGDQGMGDDILDYYESVGPSLPNHHPAAEIGVWTGRSIIHLGAQVRKWGLSVNLVGVDTFDGGPLASPGMKDFVALQGGNLLKLATANVAEADMVSLIRLIQGESAEVAAALVAEPTFTPFGFLFFDVFYTDDQARHHLDAWLPLLMSGGLVAGHHWHDHPDIQPAVLERCPGAQSKGGDIWYWRKP